MALPKRKIRPMPIPSRPNCKCDERQKDKQTISCAFFMWVRSAFLYLFWLGQLRPSETMVVCIAIPSPAISQVISLRLQMLLSWPCSSSFSSFFLHVRPFLYQSSSSNSCCSATFLLVVCLFSLLFLRLFYIQHLHYVILQILRIYASAAHLHMLHSVQPLLSILSSSSCSFSAVSSFSSVSCSLFASFSASSNNLRWKCKTMKRIACKG